MPLDLMDRVVIVTVVVAWTVVSVTLAWAMSKVGDRGR